MWKFFNSGIKSAHQNMELDASLLEGLILEPRPLLHFYQWERDSATYGYFIKPDRFFDLEKVKSSSFDLARRPTGGGIVFHTWDLAFSVLLPSTHAKFSQNPLENYKTVNSWVLTAVKDIFLKKSGLSLLPEEAEGVHNLHTGFFCMAKPTKYDVILEGRKIAGAAQRKKRQGLLHQGTISIAPPKRELLESLFLSSTNVIEEMFSNSHVFLPSNWDALMLEKTREELGSALKEVILNT